MCSLFCRLTKVKTIIRILSTDSFMKKCIILLAILAISTMLLKEHHMLAIKQSKQHDAKLHVPMLILFSTCRLEVKKMQVITNTLTFGRLWKPHIHPVLFTNDSVIANLSQFHQWDALPLPRTSCGGVPILKSMFERVEELYPATFYGYFNSDIIFDAGLYKTLTILSSLGYAKDKPILLIGRRTNINCSVQPLFNTLDEIKLMVSVTGKIYNGWAEDFFITNSLFPWTNVPDLVVGRPAYDNWLVLYARDNNMTVIDVTETVLAVHQTTAEGNKAGFRHENSNCNRQLIKRLNLHREYKKGCIECAPFFTKYDRRENIIVAKRILPPKCIII